MKKIILVLTLILNASSAFAALGYDDTRVSQINKSSYSKNMFLLLECLSTAGLSDNYRAVDLAMDHCKQQMSTMRDLNLVYKFLPSPFIVDLDRYQNRTSDMIVCLSGIRGTKVSDDESVQNPKDQAAISECEDLLIPVGGSAILNRIPYTQ